MLLILLILLISDLFFFKGIRHLLKHRLTKKQKKILSLLFWAHSIGFIAGTLLVSGWMHNDYDPAVQRKIYCFVGLFLAFYIPKLLFIPFNFSEDIIRYGSMLIIRIVGRRKTEEVDNNLKITRIAFLTKAGLIFAAIPFGSLIFGMTSVKFNFRIKKFNLHFNDLPDRFTGFRIVHISDLHIGSLYGHHEKIAEAVKMINSLYPDIICFTGDIVNDFAGEMNGWFEILGKMKARIGKYSILGNHDYGDYHYWSSDDEKKKNLEMIKQAHQRLGFKLLLNKSITLTRQDNSIAIVGVENWGKPPFAQYGDLNAACKGLKKTPFKILLTHDPSHWDAEVLNKKDIPLTLSGHTHGMQFGVNIGKIKWSPVQLKYPRWIGLYAEGEQLLYVNPGLGYIGYPGRVGISPEITFIELKRKTASILKQPLSKSV
jgi:hypothetical protein